MLLGEFIAPPLDNYARQFRTLMKHGQSSMPLGGGAWLRDGDTIISLGAQDEDFRYGVVYMFRMDGARLTSVARADSAEVDETDQWVLNNYAKTSFGSDGVTVQESSRAIQPYSLNAEVLALMVVRPSSLTGAAMYKYIRYLKANELDARRYEVALWSRVASAVAVLPMCLLALPFAFRDLRSSSTGARLVVGVIIGLAYFLASRTLGDGAAVYQLNPVFVAWLPTVLLGLAVVLLLRRVR
jgi:lipopolysaccharide export system permease protein